MYYGGIEAGGTKFICAVSNEELEIVQKVTIQTTTPEKTLEGVFEFFDQHNLLGIGIGSFGPIDVNKSSATYGYITSTPKNGWENFNFLGTIKDRYNIPIKWTTDVNAAAYGELKRGNGVNSKSCIYLTVGTGIGGGLVYNGKILEDFGHPEMGHIFIQKHSKDAFEGSCPYHRSCLEGLASGLAIETRYLKKGHQLFNDHKVWELEAYYIAQALVNYTLIIRPEIIILGGGVMKQKQLYGLVRDNFGQMLGGYLEVPNLKKYILEPGLGENSGIMGCLLLASE